jgi:tetratricopeptide (TPR) repeat protein
MQTGIKLIEDASTISQDAANNWISKAFYEIAKGQLNSALSNCKDFESQLISNSSDIEKQGLKALCSLARTIIEFNKGNYKGSLTEIRNLIKANPYAPSDVWFALGLCYYRTGNIPKAKLSFDKTLELDQNNSMALASLGIIEMVIG